MKKLLIFVLLAAIIFTLNFSNVNATVASDEDGPHIIKPVVQVASDEDGPHMITPVIQVASDEDGPHSIIIPKV